MYEDDKGKYSGYCFSCSTYLPKLDGDFVPVLSSKPEEYVAEQIEEISGYGSCTLNDRHLNKSTLDHFGVKVGVSMQDGTTPEVLYFPFYKNGELVAWKCKLIPNKKFWITGEFKDADFFGWSKALASDSSVLYITEGEIDALTVHQVLRKRNDPKYPLPAVVSLPSGASSASKFLSSRLPELQRFKKVVFVFDNDEVGRKATADCMKIMPRAKSVELPAKDPNEALLKGHERALSAALLFKQHTPKNTKVVLLDSLIDAALKPIPLGYSWPWDGLTRLTRGLRFGETYYFGAGVKMGKSDLANSFVAHFATTHGLPVYIANMEETNVKSTKKILGKVAGKIFHDPNVPFQKKELLEAAQKIKGKVHFVDAYQHITWDYLQQDVYSVVNNLGVKIVLIDPITNLTNGISAGETDAVLRGVAQDLAAMARDLDIAIFIFCHLRSPEGNSSHERGAKVQSFQFTGSRAMARSCNYMVGLEGNKDPLLPIEERNIRKLVILEDREFGETGIVPLYWDHHTQLFSEIEIEG